MNSLLAIYAAAIRTIRYLTCKALKMACGASTLFFLAASLSMASASSTLPCESSQRGDSGMNLPHHTTQWREKLNAEQQTGQPTSSRIVDVPSVTFSLFTKSFCYTLHTSQQRLSKKLPWRICSENIKRVCFLTTRKAHREGQVWW